MYKVNKVQENIGCTLVIDYVYRHCPIFNSFVQMEHLQF